MPALMQPSRKSSWCNHLATNESGKVPQFRLYVSIIPAYGFGLDLNRIRTRIRLYIRTRICMRIRLALGLACTFALTLVGKTRVLIATAQ